jgi:hypothetical protein
METAVTQAEIEAKLGILNDQFLRFQQQQEGFRRHWFRIGMMSLGFGMVFAIAVVIFSIMSLSRGAPNPSTPFGLAMIPLLLLGIALVGAGSRHQPQSSEGARLDDSSKIDAV